VTRVTDPDRTAVRPKERGAVAESMAPRPTALMPSSTWRRRMVPAWRRRGSVAVGAAGRPRAGGEDPGRLFRDHDRRARLRRRRGLELSASDRVRERGASWVGPEAHREFERGRLPTRRHTCRGFDSTGPARAAPPAGDPGADDASQELGVTDARQSEVRS